MCHDKCIKAIGTLALVRVFVPLSPHEALTNSKVKCSSFLLSIKLWCEFLMTWNYFNKLLCNFWHERQWIVSNVTKFHSNIYIGKEHNKLNFKTCISKRQSSLKQFSLFMFNLMWSSLAKNIFYYLSWKSMFASTTFSWFKLTYYISKDWGLRAWRVVNREEWNQYAKIVFIRVSKVLDVITKKNPMCPLLCMNLYAQWIWFKNKLVILKYIFLRVAPTLSTIVFAWAQIEHSLIFACFFPSLLP